MTVRCLARPEETNPNWNFFTGQMNPDPWTDKRLWPNKYGDGWKPTSPPDYYDKRWQPIDRPVQQCLHDSCSQCQGTGRKYDGSMCVHMISCPCPKCSPQC